MRYAYIRLREKGMEKVYRIYVTDALYALTKGGQHMTKRWIDVVDPDRNVVDETRTPEEIINGIRDKLKKVTSE